MEHLVQEIEVVKAGKDWKDKHLAYDGLHPEGGCGDFI